MEKRIIKLPQGGDLEVLLTPAFLEIVRGHFDLKNTVDVDNDHIRLFIYGSTKTALDKSPVIDE
jgi:hypothetical protein